MNTLILGFSTKSMNLVRNSSNFITRHLVTHFNTRSISLFLGFDYVGVDSLILMMFYLLAKFD